MVNLFSALFIKTPFPAFPQGGRCNQSFPPWGKMKGGKFHLNNSNLLAQSFNLYTEFRIQSRMG
jgi:hypothetical protein